VREVVVGLARSGDEVGLAGFPVEGELAADFHEALLNGRPSRRRGRGRRGRAPRRAPGPSSRAALAAGRGRCRAGRSHQGTLNPKLESVSSRRGLWWTRCMSGVTTSRRSGASSGPRFQVRVVEEGGRVEDDFESRHGEKVRAEQGDGGHLDHHGEKDLERVEAHARGRVEVEVGVVHRVQAPQHGDQWKRRLLEVDQQVEQEQGQGELQRVIDGPLVQEAEPRRLGAVGRSRRRRRAGGRATAQRAEGGEAQVRQPARARVGRADAARQQALAAAQASSTPRKMARRIFPKSLTGACGAARSRRASVRRRPCSAPSSRRARGA